MKRLKILIKASFMPELLEHLEADYDVSNIRGEKDKDAFLKSRGADFEVLVTSSASGADAALIGKLPNLRIIVCFGVGLDAIDLPAAEARGIVVTNTARVLDDCVADTALGLLLTTARRLVEADRFVRAGRWPQERFSFGMKVSGKRCGIVGLGNIGHAIAKRAEAFGMSIAYFGRHKKKDVNYPFYSDVKELAKAVDVLIVSVSGGPSTEALIDAGVLEALGQDGILINIARGSVVDEKALISALAGKKIRGAGLDVFADEPNVPVELMAMENVVLLPHIASATFETRMAMAHLVLHNLKAYAEHDLSRLKSRVQA